MAKKINNFWSRFCGLCVGVFCGGHVLNSAHAVSCMDTLDDRVLTCGEQGYAGALDSSGGQISDTEEYLDTADVIRSTGVKCAGDLYNLYYADGCDYGVYLCVRNSRDCTAPHCDDVAVDTDSKSYSCLMREEYEGSAGMGISIANGMVGYSGPLIVGAAYRCNSDTGTIDIVANCYENSYVLFGCGTGVNMDGLLKRDSSLFTVNSANKIIATVDATMEKDNFGIAYGYGDSISSLANFVASSGYSCKSCNVPETGGITASDVQYAGDASVGVTWNPESCYFQTSTSDENSDKFTDCTGTFYYPMSSGQVCDCWYNRGTEGLANCS